MRMSYIKNEVTPVNYVTPAILLEVTPEEYGILSTGANAGLTVEDVVAAVVEGAMRRAELSKEEELAMVQSAFDHAPEPITIVVPLKAMATLRLQKMTSDEGRTEQSIIRSLLGLPETQSAPWRYFSRADALASTPQGSAGKVVTGPSA